MLAFCTLAFSSGAHAEQVALLKSKSLGEGLPKNGVKNLVISYTRNCYEEFVGFLTRENEGSLEVRVIAKTRVPDCRSAAVEDGVTIWVDQAARVKLIQPDL